MALLQALRLVVVSKNEVDVVLASLMSSPLGCSMSLLPSSLSLLASSSLLKSPPPFLPGMHLTTGWLSCKNMSCPRLISQGLKKDYSQDCALKDLARDEAQRILRHDCSGLVGFCCCKAHSFKTCKTFVARENFIHM